jgi:hypothetical protein
LDYHFRITGGESSTGVLGESFIISNQGLIHTWIMNGTIPNGVKENLELCSKRVTGQQLKLDNTIKALRAMIIAKGTIS